MTTRRVTKLGVTHVFSRALPHATLVRVKLGELISNRRRELGLSLAGACDRAHAAGFELTRTTLNNFENHELTESPRRRTMEAIAIAVDVPYSEVVMAVANSMAGGDGLVPVTEAQHVRSWLTLTEGLSDEQVESMLQVVRSVASAIEQRHPDEVRERSTSHDE